MYKSKLSQIILFATPSILVWPFVLLIYWPGLMSHDSVVQWAEIINGQFSDYHPAFHTFFMLIGSRLFGGSPSAVPFIQILFLGVVAGWGIATLRSMGVHILVCWTGSILFALIPINFVLVNTIWKDIPYSIACLSLCIVFLKMVISKGLWLNSFYKYAFLAILFVLISLFRHNGLAVTMLSVLSLLFLYKNQILKILITGSVAIFIILIIKGPLFTALNVKPSTDFYYGIISYHIGAHLSYGTEFTEDELEFLDNIMPISEKWYYSCSTNMSLILNNDGTSKANLDFLENNRGRYLSLYLRAFQRNPFAIGKHIICTTAYMWNPRAPLGGRYPIHTKPNIWWVSNNNLGIVSNSKIPNLVNPVTRIIKYLDIIWRPSLFIYANVFLITVLYFRDRTWKWVVPFLPSLFNILVLIFVTPSQEFRYHYPSVVVLMLFWPLLFLTKNQNSFCKNS